MDNIMEIAMTGAATAKSARRTLQRLQQDLLDAVQECMSDANPDARTANGLCAAMNLVQAAAVQLDEAEQLLRQL